LKNIVTAVKALRGIGARDNEVPLEGPKISYAPVTEYVQTEAFLQSPGRESTLFLHTNYNLPARRIFVMLQEALHYENASKLFIANLEFYNDGSLAGHLPLCIGGARNNVFKSTHARINTVLGAAPLYNNGPGDIGANAITDMIQSRSDTMQIASPYPIIAHYFDDYAGAKHLTRWPPYHIQPSYIRGYFDSIGVRVLASDMPGPTYCFLACQSSIEDYTYANSTN